LLSISFLQHHGNVTKINKVAQLLLKHFYHTIVIITIVFTIIVMKWYDNVFMGQQWNKKTDLMNEESKA